MDNKNISIEVKNLTFAYEEGQSILENVTFTLHEHEAVGLIGANGTGKSTLLKLLVGLYSGYSGNILVESISVEKRNYESIRERIGYVFQDSDNQLFMPTVYDDVAFAPRNYGLPEDEVRTRADNALERVDLTHLKDRSVYKLSGGEKKLVSIATILSMTPHIILMDEPSVTLDPRNRRNLISILNSLDHTKLIASHDLDFIWDTCSRVLLLNRGSIIRSGTPGEILRDAELLADNGLEPPLSLIQRNV